MLPVRRDSIGDLTSWHRDLDDLLRRTFGSFGETEGGVAPMMTPKVNTYIREDVYHLEVELPGLERKDIDVSIEGNLLTLRGERMMTKEMKEREYLLQETRFGSFLRRVSLPEGVNPDQVHAFFQNGILSITMPVEKKLPGGRKIEIEAGPEFSGKRPIH